MTTEKPQDDRRLNAALWLVLRRYYNQVRQCPRWAIPALLLPALGDVLTIYAPPIIVARLLGAFATRERLTFSDFLPYLAAFAGLWVAGQIVWRVAVAAIIRAEIRALEALYVEAMDELRLAGVARLAIAVKSDRKARP